MVLPMEVVGPVLGIGTLIMITASAIVMIRRLAPGTPAGTSGQDRLLDDVRGRLDELDQLRQRVTELEERIDFAERVLAKQREAPRIGPPPAGERMSMARSSRTRVLGKAKPEASGGRPASRLIDQRIRELVGWRGETLARMRALILDADPGMTEEWKWNNPVWSHDGIVCTGEAYTKAVKLTFARGAGIPDPSHLFNASLAGGTRRAIDIHEGEKVPAGAFKALVKAAVARNRDARPVKAKQGGKAAVTLLSGGQSADREGGW